MQTSKLNRQFATKNLKIFCGNEQAERAKGEKDV
jgi:hypothetical protein